MMALASSDSATQVLFVLSILGTVVFAATGALQARARRFDLFGALVVGTVTAVGGGSLRDGLLGTLPVFWVREVEWILWALGSSLLAFFAGRADRRPGWRLLVLDALGLAAFTVAGAQAALAAGAHLVIALIMGTMSGVAGGIIRDLLTGQPPLILQRDFYATASLVGGGVYLGLFLVGAPAAVAMAVGFIVIVALRLLAVRFGWCLPGAVEAEG